MALDGISGRPPSIQQKGAKTLLRFSGIRPCSQNHLLPDTYRHEDPFVETRTARVEALEAALFDCGLGISDCGLRTNVYIGRMNADEFKNRTKAFAIRVIRLVEALPKNQTAIWS